MIKDRAGEQLTWLFLSFHTIHSHTKSIYTRLGVSSRDEAIERARGLELL
jgi:ATP/maltotriose-dependent transcriptional regulator MalT